MTNRGDASDLPEVLAVPAPLVELVGTVKQQARHMISD